jgi:hypothetical protein
VKLDIYAAVIFQSSGTSLAIGSSNQKSVKSHAVLQPAQNSYPGQQFIVTSKCLTDKKSFAADDPDVWFCNFNFVLHCCHFDKVDVTFKL